MVTRSWYLMDNELAFVCRLLVVNESCPEGAVRSEKEKEKLIGLVEGDV